MLELGLDVDARDAKGRTPLLYSSMLLDGHTGTAQTGILKRLLDHGADVNARAQDGATAFCHVLDNPRALKVLLARGLDPNVALADGYAPATPCVSGPNSGAMGVHLINGTLLGKELDAETPEALIYEPYPDGRMRLVGVEFITFASDWVDTVPVLDGHLLHYVGAPNRYGIPAFYEIHVWAWRNNPDGSFADWNPRVTCAGQPTTNERWFAR